MKETGGNEKNVGKTHLRSAFHAQNGPLLSKTAQKGERMAQAQDLFLLPVLLTTFSFKKTMV